MKKLLLLTLTFTLMFSLFGCAKKAPLNKEALKTDVLNNVTFEVPLEKVGANAISVLFTLESGVTAEVYKGSSIYPDQFGVFSAPDSKSASSTEKMLQDYKQSLLTDYSHYNAEQISKIKDAVIYRRDLDVVFLICDQNNEALKIIERN